MPRPKKEEATQGVTNDEEVVIIPQESKVEKRFFQVTTTKEIFSSDDFSSEEQFDAYLKSPKVIKLESINGSPVIAASGMDYIQNKIAELEAREKLLIQRENQK